MQQKKYISWFALSIVLPLLPFLIKLLIVIMGDSGALKTTILDSVELLYYNLFICVTFYSISFEKREISILEFLLRYFVAVIIVIDIVVIVLIYTGMAKEQCLIASVVLSVVVVTGISIYQWNNFKEELHDAK